MIGAVVALLGDERYISELRAQEDPGLERELAALEARKAETEQQFAALVDNPHVRPKSLTSAIAGSMSGSRRCVTGSL